MLYEIFVLLMQDLFLMKNSLISGQHQKHHKKAQIQKNRTQKRNRFIPLGHGIQI
jgi:hypothetical protein